MYIGKFWLLEPQTTAYSKEKMTKPEDFVSADDFCLSNQLILEAIVEYNKRLNSKKDD